MSFRVVRTTLALTAVSALALGTTAWPSAQATPTGRPFLPRESPNGVGWTVDGRPVNVDTRYTGSTTRSPSLATPRGHAIARLDHRLGGQGGVEIDPLTGTPRNVGRIDGFLTGASNRSPESIALSYVRSHPKVFGLSHAALATLRLRNSYTDLTGTTHLQWQQLIHHVPVYGNGLEAHVSSDGRLIAVQGSPIARIATKASTIPGITAAQARADAVANVGGTLVAARETARIGPRESTQWSNGDTAGLVWFYSPKGLQLGWLTYTDSGTNSTYTHVISAKHGKVLFRQDLVSFDRGDALVVEQYPGATLGGHQHKVSLFKRHFVSRKATWLKGRTVTAFADLNDNNNVDKGERTPVPGTKLGAQFKWHLFHVGDLCSRKYLCTWNPHKQGSWRKNKNQDVTQAFYLASQFHDYLAKAPIGFTAAAGAFSAAGHDPVMLNALDGANTNNGMPDLFHVDNANMSTPPDGKSPRMQMYLFHAPGKAGKHDPFLPSSSADQSEILYHEYTHGLSNRLVTNANGHSTLGTIQGASMGEAWSDYYPLDYLVFRGFWKDTKKAGDMIVGRGVSYNKPIVRSEALDCDPGSQSSICVQADGTQGGYTYGDFRRIPGDVHIAGEIWSQTLWDMRDVLGHNKTDMLTTRAMELSVDRPSMLDMRNAIFQADTAVYNGADEDALWQIFAKRGMGFFATTKGPNDFAPVEDFHAPQPNGAGRYDLTGTITNFSGTPLAGVPVVLYGGLGDYAAISDAKGAYTIPNVVAGTYGRAVVAKKGYDGYDGPLTVSKADHDFSPVLRRNFADVHAGATLVNHTGVDFYSCPDISGGFDANSTTAWVANTGPGGAPTSDPQPRYAVIFLPSPVTVTGYAIDAHSPCDYGPASSVRHYRVEVSPDVFPRQWTTVADDSLTTAEASQRQTFTLSPVAGVRFVRLWLDNNHLPAGTDCANGNRNACFYMGVSDFFLYGTP
jgi:extracellular elastinolytic metalloproteinase